MNLNLPIPRLRRRRLPKMRTRTNVSQFHHPYIPILIQPYYPLLSSPPNPSGRGEQNDFRGQHPGQHQARAAEEVLRATRQGEECSLPVAHGQGDLQEVDDRTGPLQNRFRRVRGAGERRGGGGEMRANVQGAKDPRHFSRPEEGHQPQDDLRGQFGLRDSGRGPVRGVLDVWRTGVDPHDSWPQRVQGHRLRHVQGEERSGVGASAAGHTDQGQAHSAGEVPGPGEGGQKGGEEGGRAEHKDRAQVRERETRACGAEDASGDECWCRIEATAEETGIQGR